MHKELRIKIATAIAKKARKWGNNEQQLMLAAILRNAGVEDDRIQEAVNDAAWHGIVTNGSQFSQWVDGVNAKTKQTDIVLDFKLRATSEQRVDDILASLDALGE